MPTWKPTKPRPPRDENAWKQPYFDRPAKRMDRVPEQVVQIAQLIGQDKAVRRRRDRRGRPLLAGRYTKIAGLTFLSSHVQLATQLRWLLRQMRNAGRTQAAAEQADTAVEQAHPILAKLARGLARLFNKAG